MWLRFAGDVFHAMTARMTMLATGDTRSPKEAVGMMRL
jgi:hypothetical protein